MKNYLYKYKNKFWLIQTLFFILVIMHLSCYENIISPSGQNIFLDDTCTVLITSVTDGDTYEVTEQDDKIRIQVIDFDCYELKKTNKLLEQAEFAGIAPDSAVALGQQAKRLAERLLLNRKVLLVRDSSVSNFDSFSGLNRKVYVNGENIKEIFKFYGLLALEE